MIRRRGLFQKQTKNRSSKHLLMLPSQRDILRCWSAAALEEHSKKADRAGNQFERELQRRAAKRAKRAAKAKS